MKFLITDAEVKRRYYFNEINKHEKIEVLVQLRSSGDTTLFSNLEIVSIIMDRLEEIEPKKRDSGLSAKGEIQQLIRMYEDDVCLLKRNRVPGAKFKHSIRYLEGKIEALKWIISENK